jgi:hypothetical protein
MEVDPESLDPELRNAGFLALASASLGLMSLCGALIPICGGIASALGIVLGAFSLKAERSKIAMAGIGISILGMLITITYTLLLVYNK